jgi:FMN-dependent oxidoreductase (nitrilotriacetate monooxygenase family)
MSAGQRLIRFNAFEMNCVVHQSPGLWRLPGDRSTDYKRLDYWTGLAKTLERGLFDGVFIADVLGAYDVFGGGPEAALSHGVQVPVNDPMLLVPAMAQVTEHLGFGVTVNLSYEPPYGFARRMSTLDHLTEGRIGWNVVTGYLDSAARANGRDRQTAHDDRYEIAEEYMGLVKQLWTESWDGDAVRADRRAGVYADPAKVRAIHHAGKHFKLQAIHLSEPSPQRVPVIYQAGTSPAGAAFAARHAECVFVSGPTKDIIRARVDKLRAERRAAGKGPLRIYALLTIITGATSAEARRKHEAYLSVADTVGALTLMSGWTGVDFSQLKPDEPVRHVVNDAGRTALENVTRADPDRVWTVEAVARHVAIGGIGPVLVGDPGEVADQLESWVDHTGVDGFNLAFASRPETFESVVDLIVPELQRRGRYQRHYAEGTLRDKLFGRAEAPAARRATG